MNMMNMMNPPRLGRDPSRPRNYPDFGQSGRMMNASGGTGGSMNDFDGRGFHRRDPRRDSPTMTQAFIPGQDDALARQMSFGFGGGMKPWRQMFNQTYSPMPHISPFDPTPHHRRPGDDKNGDGKGDDGGDGDRNGDGDVTNDDIFNSHSRIGLFRPGNLQGSLTGGQMNGMSNMTGGQMQSPMNGGLMSLNPQTLALLRQMFMR